MKLRHGRPIKERSALGRLPQPGLMLTTSSYADMVGSEQTDGYIVASIIGAPGVVGSLMLFSFPFVERDDLAERIVRRQAEQRKGQGS